MSTPPADRLHRCLHHRLHHYLAGPTTPPGRPSRFGAGRRILAAAVALAAIGTIGGGCASDASIRSLAAQTNRDVLARTDHLAGDPEVQAYVDELARELLEAARRVRPADAGDDWVYDELGASVVLDPSVNAFVTGDDRVFLHSGLIESLEHPDQVMAVMTHELSHNELRHLGNNIKGRSADSLLDLLGLAAGVVGDVAGKAISTGARAARILNKEVNRSFNRRQELEADAAGLDLYVAMGYDPRQFRRVFEILEDDRGGTSGTHPRNEERIEQIDALAAAEQDTYRTLDLDRFREIQAIVAREESAFAGAALRDDPAVRSSIVSCFDYNAD